MKRMLWNKYFLGKQKLPDLAQNKQAKTIKKKKKQRCSKTAHPQTVSGPGDFTREFWH